MSKVNHYKQEIDRLNAALIVNAYQYYELDNSCMEDCAYDRLYKALKGMIEMYGYKPKHCILDMVGSPSEKVYIGAKLFLNEKETSDAWMIKIRN